MERKKKKEKKEKNKPTMNETDVLYKNRDIKIHEN